MASRLTRSVQKEGLLSSSSGSHRESSVSSPANCLIRSANTLRSKGHHGTSTKISKPPMISSSKGCQHDNLGLESGVGKGVHHTWAIKMGIVMSKMTISGSVLRSRLGSLHHHGRYPPPALLPGAPKASVSLTKLNIVIRYEDLEHHLPPKVQFTQNVILPHCSNHLVRFSTYENIPVHYGKEPKNGDHRCVRLTECGEYPYTRHS